MASIYIHIPLCASRCSYCDFYSSTLAGVSDQLCSALRGEMRERQKFLQGQSVETIYFGGGTPSLLPVAQIESTINCAKELFDCQLREVTLESNPNDLTQEYLDALAQTDVNRLSIGIQSFDEATLRFLNRRHSAHQAKDAVLRARQAGFENITIDLMFGIAPMSRSALIDSINEAISLDVEHISAYHLTIEQGTPLEKMGLRSVDELRSETEFNIVHTMLTEAHYEHYEVSNFARKGHRAIHNSNYWNGTHYLGIGPSAHSYNGTQRLWAEANIKQYIASGAHLTVENLTQEEQFNEFIMTRLRTADGIDMETLRECFGDKFSQHLQHRAKVSLEEGNLTLKNGVYAIPASKFLLSDMVISELFI